MLDVVPDPDRLREAFDRASRIVLRLRQHVVVPALPVAAAEWITDPDFDLDFHLRRVRLPEPGTIRHLLDFSTQVMSAPFDTARPLWEVQLIDGITEGEYPAALLVKFHHAITDGIGGVELFRQLYDFEREVDRGPLPPIPSPEDVSSTDLARNALRRLPLTTALDVARRTSARGTTWRSLPPTAGSGGHRSREAAGIHAAGDGSSTGAPVTTVAPAQPRPPGRGPRAATRRSTSSRPCCRWFGQRRLHRRLVRSVAAVPRGTRGACRCGAPGNAGEPQVRR